MNTTTPKGICIGYARTSTLDQKAGLDAQKRDLEAAGCDRLFIEQVSSVDVKERHKLAEALDFMREGDTLTVTRLDRLARSTQHLLEVLTAITDKGAALRILDMGIDTRTPTGKLLLTVMGGVAEFERSIMLERQREGIAKAKAAGKYKGRKPTARAKADDVKRLHTGGMGATAIAREVGIGRASVYRILAADGAGAG
ncbi:recombinase family protein [Pseudaestuariivita sp.]|uniref:recombinase family protein n=1 Tax=Pseudaestuariivita sp. TaxID=2211669 RepID=UPI004059D1E8